MSEEYSDRGLEAVHEKVRGWFDAFVKSLHYDALTETQTDKAPDVINFFAEYSFNLLGMTPEKWNPSGLTECCLEVLPRKVSAGPVFFKAVAPVLSAFFIFLADQSLLHNGRLLAQTVAGLDEEILTASQDRRSWGPAKAFAMAAEEAGVDLRDEDAINQFMAEYNLRFAGRPQPALQEPFSPATSLPKPVETVRYSEPKVGRNDRCPCGSGKKFKKCCGR